MKVLRLTDRHTEAIEECLLADPLVNLFLIGYLDAVPVNRAYWYGVPEGDRIRGLALLVPTKLIVPFAPLEADAAAIGHVLRGRHRPTMMVGPRLACDALWEAWTDWSKVDRWHDQRLYVCASVPDSEVLTGFRRAHPDDLDTVAPQAAQMEFEDLGRDVVSEDPDAFRAAVLRRIQQGQTWVLERDGDVLFQINVGTVTTWGVQVGGTFVPAPHRGKGLATAAMRELVRRLLPKHRAVTLHVNEANTPAVRAYERAGFTPLGPYRVVTLRAGA